jgi:CheY-like chemotaxis protein
MSPVPVAAVRAAAPVADQSAYRSFTVRQLPGFGEAVVDDAGDGATAFRMVQAEKHRFVLADVRMPGMDGIELVRRIRGDLGDTALPIVLVTTLGTEEDIARGRAAGATAYVVKPLSPHHIRMALLEILEPAIKGPSLEG